MLCCMNTFSTDKQRNLYILSSLDQLNEISGSELYYALIEYEFDEGRILFVSMIKNKISVIIDDDLLACLKTF